VASLLPRPATLLANGNHVRHSRIRLPVDIYAPARRNSIGMEFGDAAARFW
jgi:RHH-type proline utilization regulon transcriptional repressor/proline dehydrogenase/delta 1-pyrroline-5-carboxylate dehydrogenase